MNVVDTHCHLDFDVFSSDREDVINRARARGLSAFIIPAVKMSSWESLVKLCSAHTDLYYALGLHPMFIREHEKQHIYELKKKVASTDPIAIGEIGLDFYDRSLEVEKQRDIFELQLELAGEFKLPVILHVRKAHEDVLAILANHRISGGVVHAFNGSMQQADRYMQHGFKFGFGGMLTYERSSKLRALAKQLPISSIVLETDSPDMTVQAHRGKRNSPEYVIDCLHALANVRGMTIKEVAQETTLNARDLFAGLRA